MPLPRLIHPVNVEVESLDAEESVFDPDFKQPVTRVRTSYNLPGQVKWEAHNEAGPTGAGVELIADGYVLFRQDDLRSAGWTPKQGDKLLAFGSGPNRVAQALFVVRLRPMGHYPDQGGATLLKCFFRDKAPIQ